MPDDKQHLINQAVTNGPASATTAPPDPLRSLHKMSTTAGVGSSEYVAINGMSIAAAICGLASSLSLLDNTLLVIPLAGIFFGIIALRQIASSNETQTGRLLAWSGILLSCAFALSV